MKLPKINKYVKDTDAWIKIVGHCILGKNFSNPHRKDSNPSAVLFEAKSGDILLHDFKDGTFNWRSYLNFYLGYDKTRIGEFIKNNNLLITTTNFKQMSIAKPKPKIDYILKDWCTNDTEYWLQFNITKEICEYFKVYPVKYTWINGVICHTYTNNSPVYIFILDSVFKIYAPYHNQKWLTTTSGDDYQGYNQLPWLGELLIITKSMKDVMSLYSLNYSAIAPHSEGQKIDNSFIELLKKRFTEIVILYDNDEAGIKASNKLHRLYNFKQIYMKKSKDVSDNIKNYGIEETFKELKHELE